MTRCLAVSSDWCCQKGSWGQVDLSYCFTNEHGAFDVLKSSSLGWEQTLQRANLASPAPLRGWAFSWRTLSQKIGGAGDPEVVLAAQHKETSQCKSGHLPQSRTFVSPPWSKKHAGSCYFICDVWASVVAVSYTFLVGTKSMTRGWPHLTLILCYDLGYSKPVHPSVWLAMTHGVSGIPRQDDTQPLLEEAPDLVGISPETFLQS